MKFNKILFSALFLCATAFIARPGAETQGKKGPWMKHGGPQGQQGSRMNRGGPRGHTGSGMNRGGFQGHRGSGMNRGGSQGQKGGRNHGGSGKSKFSGRDGHKPFKHLDLSDEQKSKLSSMGKESKKKAIQLKADLEFARIDLEAELRKDNPDRGVVTGILGKISAANASLMADRVLGRLDFKNVLTPEQKEKMKKPAKGYKGDRGEKDGK